MRDAGLTHGGFYKHFRNKNELLVEATAEAFRDMGARIAARCRASAAWRNVEGHRHGVPEPESLRSP